jgi:16S rRNA processing protein RimM
MDYLATGVLKGPHGIHGFIKLHSYSDEYEHLMNLGVVLLRKDGKEKKLTLQEIKPAGKELLVKFEGLDTPETVRTYNGWEIWIPRDSAARLQEGEFYVADLASCSLVVDKKTVGKVVGVIDGPQALLLEIESILDGKKYLVPFMEHYIGTVDLDRKELELLAPELLS